VAIGEEEKNRKNNVKQNGVKRQGKDQNVEALGKEHKHEQDSDSDPLRTLNFFRVNMSKLR